MRSSLGSEKASSQEILFKKINMLARAYQKSLADELAKIKGNPDAKLLKKQKEISDLIEMLGVENDPDKKIYILQGVVAAFKENLSEKRGVGKLNPFLKSNGQKFTEQVESLLAVRMKAAEIEKTEDIYFLDVDNTLMEMDEATPIFNEELIDFLKGKKVYILSTFNPDHADYSEPLRGDVIKRLQNIGVKVNGVFTQRDLWLMEANPEHKLGDAYLDGQLLEEAIHLARQVLTKEEYNTSKAKMATKRFIDNFQIGLLGENYFNSDTKLEDVIKNLPALVKSSRGYFFQDKFARKEVLDFSEMTLESISGWIKKYNATLGSAQERSAATVGRFLAYMKEELAKFPPLAGEKLKAANDLEKELYALRNKNFLMQFKLISEKPQSYHSIDDFEFSKGDVYGKVVEKFQKEGIIKQETRIISVDDSRKKAHAPIQDAHRKKGFLHKLLTLLPFRKKEEAAKPNGFGSSIPEDYVSRTEFVGQIFEKSVRLIHSELQAMLFAPHLLVLLKADKKEVVKIKLQGETYEVASVVAEIVNLLQAQSVTSAQALQRLIDIQEMADKEAKSHPSCGVTGTLCRLVAQSLRDVGSDPAKAQQELSDALHAFDRALQAEAATAKEEKQAERPRVIFLLDVDDTIIESGHEVNESLLKVINEAKQAAKDSGKEFIVELLTAYEPMSKTPAGVLRYDAIQALDKHGITVDRVVIQGKKLNFYENNIKPLELVLVELREKINIQTYGKVRSIEDKEQVLDAMHFLTAQPEFKEIEAALDPYAEVISNLDNLKEEKRKAKADSKLDLNQKEQYLLKKRSGIESSFENWLKTHYELFAQKNTQVDFKKLIDNPSSAFLSFYRNQEAMDKLSQALAQEKDNLKLFSPTGDRELVGTEKDAALAALDKHKQLLLEYKLNYLRAGYADEQAHGHKAGHQVEATEARTGSKATDYQRIAEDRKLRAEDTVFYFDDYPRYREEVANIHQIKNNPHRLVALPPPLCGEHFSNRNAVKLQPYCEVEAIYNILKADKIGNYLLNPAHLHAWEIVPRVSHDTPKARTHFFASTPAHERVFVRDSSGRFASYELPEPIAKMVSLSLSGNYEELLKYVAEGLKRKFKDIGHQPAHEQLRCFLSGVMTSREAPVAEEKHQLHSQ